MRIEIDATVKFVSIREGKCTSEVEKVNGCRNEPDAYFRITLKGRLYLLWHETKAFIHKLVKRKESQESEE